MTSRNPKPSSPRKENVPNAAIVSSSAYRPRASKSLSNADTTAKLPRAPKSAFMCFAEAHKRDILHRHGLSQESENILNLVAQEWRNLSDAERAEWDEAARIDNTRYVQEKAAYKGPWNVPKRRAKKHPEAPKRPMSAFLKYSQTRRTRIKKENPNMGNTDVSRLLGEMWRNASPMEKGPYVEEEKIERAAYKEKKKRFDESQARKDAASRTRHHVVAANNDYSASIADYPANNDYSVSSSYQPSYISERPSRYHPYSEQPYASYRSLEAGNYVTPPSHPNPEYAAAEGLVGRPDEDPQYPESRYYMDSSGMAYRYH